MLGNNLLDQSPSPAPTHAAAGVLINILDSLFARWGLPKKITSDNGLQMVPHKLCSYLKEKGIHHIRTTFYNPSANGGVELLNQSLKNGIRAHLAQGCKFNTSLLQTLLHYRATPHATTGVSPAFLLLGRELQLPLDRVRPGLIHTPVHPAQARVNIGQGQKKNQLDRRQRARPPSIAAQDWVRIRQPHRNNKLVSFWSEPMQVSQQLGPATLRLVDGTRWHGSLLRKVLAPPTPGLSTAPATASSSRQSDLSAAWDSLQTDAPLPPAHQGAPEPNPETSAPPEPRPVRAQNQPGHLQDFETEYHT